MYGIPWLSELKKKKPIARPLASEKNEEMMSHETSREEWQQKQPEEIIDERLVTSTRSDRVPHNDRNKDMKPKRPKEEAKTMATRH